MYSQNKITSYFMNSISKKKLETKPTNVSKEKCFDYDSDCHILDESNNIEKSHINIKETNNLTNKNDLPNASSNPQPENESQNGMSTLEINSDDDKDLVDSLVNYETLGIENTGQNVAMHQDDTTIFFLNMLEDFLNKPFLHYLFDACDMDIVKSFFNLPAIDHKLLFIRMYWLQSKWYKTYDVVKKYLKYDFNENKWSKTVVNDLIENDFLLNGDKCMNFNDWTKVLLRSDLIQICNHFKINVKADKNVLIKRLEKMCTTKSTILNLTLGHSKSMEKVVLDKINKLCGNCIKISDKVRSVFDRLHVISYIGMNPAIIREKRLNLLLMNMKNGQQSFPEVCSKYDSMECVFPTKEHFTEYMHSYNLYEKHFKLTTTSPCNHNTVIEICRDTLVSYKDLKSNNALIPPIWLHSFTPAYRYLKIMEKSINSYKALKDQEYLNEALNILNTLLSQTVYRQSARAFWYGEKALILHTKLKKFNETANVLFEALNDSSLTEDAKVPLMERAKRLAMQKKVKLPRNMSKFFLAFKFELEENFPYIEISAKSVDDNCPGKKARYLFKDVTSGESTYSNVEQYALIHYFNNTEFNSGEHWEGRIICTLFVLLFWDIIYSPIESQKGIFLSPYQEAPLDLYTASFYDNRREAIDLRLKNIEDGWSSMDVIIEHMQNIFDSRKSGEVSILYNNIEWSSVAEIAQCLGRKGLFFICKRLSHMYHYAHSGFPDLTVWNAKTKKIKFVEVKGDGDKLSCKQIQWMSYLIKNGIETEVCYVHKGTKRRSPKKIAKSPKKCDPTNTEDDFEDKVKAKPRRKQKKDTAQIERIKIKDSPILSSPKTPKSSPLSQKKIKSKTPSPSPDRMSSSSQDCYLRSPSKLSKGGVGYFVSPARVEYASPGKSPGKSPNKSPNISRKRASLSLTRRRIFDADKT